MIHLRRQRPHPLAPAAHAMHQAARRERHRAENTAAERDAVLTGADAAVWRCSCGGWRLGSRDCGTCAAINREVAA